MYVSAEDARSDVILAGAATVFGGFAVGFVTRLPLYPQRGVLPMLLGVVWIFVLTGLVPLLLARYRGDRSAAFGLDAPRRAWSSGLVLAVPIVLVAGLIELSRARPLGAALLGRIGGAGRVTALTAGVDAPPVAVAIVAMQLVALAAGALLLVSFLTVRGREAFRPTEISLTALLRTVGMGAAGAALLLGVIRSIGPAATRPALLNALGLAGLVLVADRLVPATRSVPRAAVVTPLVVVVVAHVFAAGGLFRGDLLLGLYAGALGAGVAAVIAAMILTRDRAWAALPLVVAVHWWPTCLSPLAIEIGAGMC